MRAPSQVLLLAAWAFCGFVPGASAQDRIVSPEYERAVRLYARGERTAAVAALSDLRPGDLDKQVETLDNAARKAMRCASCLDPLKELPLRAAALLHADRDEMERPAFTGMEHRRVCPGEHARRAGQIASILAYREPESDFSRRFFLAMAQRCQWSFCLLEAEQWGRDALKLFPRHAPLLLTVGATLEEGATLWAPGESGVVADHLRVLAARGERDKRFMEAERFLSQAVAADPALLEARVRLGRVQFRLGRDEDARRTFEEVLRRNGAAPLPYLAHLFLGQVHERAGRSAEAIAEFTKALERDPEAQAAAVALSHALLLTGDTSRARRVLGEGLAHAGRRKTPDAQWRYVASNTERMEELWEELRRETLQ
jgi:tetratricopeptide (TPR) repeat protein